MAKVYQLEVVADSQTTFDAYAHSLLFADSIACAAVTTPAGSAGRSIIVTSGVESDPAGAGADYLLLADDSQSEVSVDISTGKFVEGNLIAVWALTSEAQSDMRDFMTFYATTGDIHLHVGVCNTTQSQDYTPDIVANDRSIKMLTPTQVVSLGL